MFLRSLFIFIFLSPLLVRADGKSETLYKSLDPTSLSKALAFYELYPQTPEGREALKRARLLFSKSENFPVEKLISKINRFELGTLPDFSEEELQLIESLALSLPNRALKGFYAKEEEELFDFPDKEIDVGTALLLTEGKRGEELRKYKAFLDLMALSIRTRIKPNATHEEKIHAINDFLFCENRYHFPPHSLYEKRIERYTFLSSVVSSHLGVCLGVSALYLAIAERLDLPLEIVTPPGHIYLRYHEGNKRIVIETTARGREVDESHYWNINMKRLHERKKKEVIGLIHINAASTALQGDDIAFAISEYEKAGPYLKGDYWYQELSAYAYLLAGNKEKGVSQLKDLLSKEDPEHITKENLAIDYLKKEVDEEGIRGILMAVDEKRSSLLDKEKKLRATLTTYPRFREGWHQLAATLLSLHRNKEGLICLEKYHEIDPSNPLVEYYLAKLYQEREDFQGAWSHLHQAEKLVDGKGGCCKALKDLRQELLFSSPEASSE